MRRSASQIIRELELRIAQLEKEKDVGEKIGQYSLIGINGYGESAAEEIFKLVYALENTKIQSEGALESLDRDAVEMFRAIKELKEAQKTAQKVANTAKSLRAKLRSKGHDV